MFKQRDVLIILWMTFITVVAWIGFNIYHVNVTSTISEALQMQITPIDPDFDTITINKLKSRQKIEPQYQYNNVSGEQIATLEASVIIIPTVIPNATNAAILLPADTITPTEELSRQVTGTP